MTSRVIDTKQVYNVAQLIDALKAMSVDVPETIYVGIESESVHLSLIEKTLSDGSIVYDIELKAAE